MYRFRVVGGLECVPVFGLWFEWTSLGSPRLGFWDCRGSAFFVISPLEVFR